MDHWIMYMRTCTEHNWFGNFDNQFEDIVKNCHIFHMAEKSSKLSALPLKADLSGGP